MVGSDEWEWGDDFGRFYFWCLLLTMSDPMVPPRHTTYRGQTFHATGTKGVMVERWGLGGVGKMSGGGRWRGDHFRRFYFQCLPASIQWSWSEAQPVTVKQLTQP